MNHQTKYAIIGLGYIAERHLRAIKETGGDVVLAFDSHETGGILDRYFLNAKFPDMQIDFWKALAASGAEYLVICTPNHLHYEDIAEGRRQGLKVICEKPLCVKYSDALTLIDDENVFTILQLRLHPTSQLLKKRIASLKKAGTDKLYVEVTYHTPRGEWYHRTWKSKNMSGGILLNIGVHIFDLLIDLFGMPKNSLCRKDDESAFCFLECENADIKVNLSISRNVTAKREIKVNGMPFDLTSGFDNLHTESYKAILEGNGFKVSDAVKALKLVDELNNKV